MSDTDAFKLIQSSYDENKSKECQNKSNNINTLILDEDSPDQSIDPFTFKLMNFEVRLNLIIVSDHSIRDGLIVFFLIFKCFFKGN